MSPLNAALAVPEMSHMVLTGSRAFLPTSAGYLQPTRDFGSSSIHTGRAALNRAHLLNNVLPSLHHATLVFTPTIHPIIDHPLPPLQSLRMLSLRNTPLTSARKSLVRKRCSLAPSGQCKVSVVLWVGSVNESSLSLS